MIEKSCLTRMVVHVRHKDYHGVFEGDVPMTDQEKDAYKLLVGDGKATITVGTELSESDFGNGGKVFVSVTLTVDQSSAGIESGEAWARHLVQAKAWEHHSLLKQKLQQHGIIK